MFGNNGLPLGLHGPRSRLLPGCGRPLPGMGGRRGLPGVGVAGRCQAWAGLAWRGRGLVRHGWVGSGVGQGMWPAGLGMGG